jgi:hypothetical protein
MTVKAEQANEHDDKQEGVSKKRDDHCHFGVLEVEGRAVVAERHPCITDLSEDPGRISTKYLI